MVFSNEECDKYFKDNFIFYKLYSGKGEEKELRKKWGVPGYPTIMVFDAEGEEIDRQIGFDGDKDKFMNTIKDWTNGIGTIKALLTEYEKNPKDIYLIQKLGTKYTKRYQAEKAIEYYNLILKQDPKDEAGYHAECYFHKAKHTLWNEENSEPLENILVKTSNSDFIEQGYDALINFFYGRGENNEKFHSIFEDAIEKMPENTGLMNKYTWYIYEEKIDSKYQTGIDIAENAVKINSDDDNLYDTLAHLYFANGEKVKAIKTLEKAIAMKPDSKYYKEELAKFNE